jgi:hypothetical protein
MKKFIHLLSVLGIVGALYSQSLADVPSAQKRLGTVPPQPITYIQTLPSAVTKRMPRGAKSCFFGYIQLPAKGLRILVHLFDPNPAQEPTKNTNSYHLVLHVLDDQGQLINVIHIGYPSTGSGNLRNSSLFGAQLLWLDPKVCRKPILKFDTFGYGETGEPIGEHILVTFPEGFSHSASVQGIPFGHYSGSNTLGRSATFNNLDDRGLLEIHSSAFFNFEVQGKSSEAKWLLHWNGSKFAAINDPFDGMPHPGDKPIW